MPTPLPKISAPAQRALDSINVSSLQELATHTEKEISDLHGMGPNALGKLKAAMAEAGIGFAKS